MSTTDLTNQRFGRLTVLTRAAIVNRRQHWTCRCDCGVTVVKNGKYLLCGDTRSCGCDQRAMRARGNPVQGNARNLHRREYSIWRSMKSRCYTTSSSNYRHYGGRGIAVCDRWRDDFAAFLADMGPCPDGLTIDRKDTNGDYETDNCRWATDETQHNNTRANLRFDLAGESLTLAQIARRSGIKYTTLHKRLFRDGLSLSDAMARG